ncbi:MAG: hypothetical protein JO007_19675 [Alphaproteobacteria bacterium]|nr:hypothetical protein [Alphaproteobacteria bacterium]
MLLLFKASRVLQTLCSALVSALLIVSSTVISQAATHQVDPYASRQFGIPDTINGYAVIAVLTEQNYACMKPGEIRLLLQSQGSNIESALRSFPGKQSELAKWESSIVGPGQTRKQLISQLERFRHFFKTYGCASLSIPTSNCIETNDKISECKKTPPQAGYAIIQNTSSELQSPLFTECPSGKVCAHAQSVILVAPIVGRQIGIQSDKDGEDYNQAHGIKQYVECTSIIPDIACYHHPGYSDILNNGTTNGNYHMQVGVYFTNHANIEDQKGGDKGVVSPGEQPCPDPSVPCYGEGLVVWTGFPDNGSDEAPRKLFSAGPDVQAATVPYIAGHEYYTTITYTSGVWWTCAADTVNLSTYECQNHNARAGLSNANLGKYLIKSIGGTNVFVEVWDEGADWASEFSPQWPAHDAMIYVEGEPPLSWESEEVLTADSCLPDLYPAKNAIASAIDGSLIPTHKQQYHDGWAYFNVLYVPPYCF